jgi:hypothetical protein
MGEGMILGVNALDLILAVLWILLVARIYLKKGDPGLPEYLVFLILFAVTLIKRVA